MEAKMEAYYLVKQAIWPLSLCAENMEGKGLSKLAFNSWEGEACLYITVKPTTDVK